MVGDGENVVSGLLVHIHDLFLGEIAVGQGGVQVQAGFQPPFSGDISEHDPILLNMLLSEISNSSGSLGFSLF